MSLMARLHAPIHHHASACRLAEAPLPPCRVCAHAHPRPCCLGTA